MSRGMRVAVLVLAVGLGFLLVRQVRYELGHYESGYIGDLSKLPGVGQEFADLRATGSVYYRIFHTIHNRHSFLVSGTLASKDNLFSFCKMKGFRVNPGYNEYGVMRIKKTCEDMGADSDVCVTGFSESDIMVSGDDRRLMKFLIAYRPKDGRFTMVFGTQ